MKKDKIINNNGEIAKNTNEIVLNKICDLDDINEKTYREIYSPNFSFISKEIVSNGLELSDQILKLNKIAEQAPNGLFTVNVNPVKLSKFADGTITTMVRDETGKLIRHEGFHKIDFPSFLSGPMIIKTGMQIMSAVSGTYYLHQINNHFNHIKTQLDSLIERNDEEDIGELLSSAKALSKIMEQKYIDFADLYDIRSYKRAIDNIYEKHLYSLKNMDTKEDISVICFKLRIIYEANKLFLFAEAIEIILRMKANYEINQINERIIQLEKNFDESFYLNYKSVINDLYYSRKNKNNNLFNSGKNELNNTIEKALDYTSLIRFGPIGVFPDITYRLFNVNHKRLKLNKISNTIVLENEKLNNLLVDIIQDKNNNEIDSFIKSVINQKNIEQKVLYMPVNDNECRIFLPMAWVYYE